MIRKAMGTLLILSAAGTAVARYYRQVHLRKSELAEMSRAMEHIATEIRWRHQMLPVILTQLTDLPHMGKRFAKITEKLKGDIPLQQLWNEEFSDFYAGMPALLTEVELSGDEKHLADSFLGASANIKSALSEWEKECREKGKIFTAVAGCGAGLLIILLM